MRMALLGWGVCPLPFVRLMFGLLCITCYFFRDMAPGLHLFRSLAVTLFEEVASSDYSE